MTMSGTVVGERLRAIRRQKGLSLHDVEARSSLEFKASVLGAYERGERAISVPRLLRLAEIYEVPADQLLPRELDGEISLVDGVTTRSTRRGFTIDLVRLHELDDPDAHDARRASRRRSSSSARTSTAGMLTIRRSDLRVLAAVHGPQPRRARRAARAARPPRRSACLSAAAPSTADRPRPRRPAHR